MTAVRFVLACSVSMLALGSACQGKGTGPQPVATKPANAGQAQATPTASPTPVAKPTATPTPTPTPTPAPTAAGTPPPTDGKALGRQFADPRWYRKTMFGDKGKAIDTKRSEADDQGRFSSLIRFELTDTTVQACADQLVEAIKDDITNAKRDAKPDGRVQISGSNDRYTVTFMCGEASGKTIAYVSYAWT